MVANKGSVLPILTLWFIVSPVLSFEETADPGVVYITLLSVPILYCGLKYRLFNIKPYHASALLMFLFGLFSTIVGPYGNLDISNLCKYLLFVIVFIALTNYKYNDVEICRITKIYIYISIAVAILIFLSFLGGYQHLDRDVVDGTTQFLGRYSVGITGVYKNPNYLTSFINVACFMLLFKLLKGKETRNKKLLYDIIILFLFVSIILTGTRTALLTFSSVFLLLFASNFLRANKIGVSIFIIAIMGLLIWIYQKEINDFIELYLGTRELLGEESRETAWSFALLKLKDNWLFGCGIGSWETLSKNTSMLQWLHNVFLEFLLNQGIMGLLLLVYTFLYGFSKTKKRDRLFLYVLVFVTALPMMFQNGVVAVNFWRFLIINRIAINYSIYSNDGIIPLVINRAT